MTGSKSLWRQELIYSRFFLVNFIERFVQYLLDQPETNITTEYSETCHSTSFFGRYLIF